MAKLLFEHTSIRLDSSPVEIDLDLAKKIGLDPRATAYDCSLIGLISASHSLYDATSGAKKI